MKKEKIAKCKKIVRKYPPQLYLFTRTNWNFNKCFFSGQLFLMARIMNIKDLKIMQTSKYVKKYIIFGITLQ